MVSSLIDATVPDLIAEAKEIAAEVELRFGNLSVRQLNWQPDAQEWSIGQCFDHLMVTNQRFFPTFERISRGEKKNSLWERAPFLPRLFGRMVIKSFEPTSTRKVQAPKVFRPSSSAIEANIISRFLEQQQQLTALMNATAGLDLEGIKVTSPVSALVTYSLIDAYRIIITHEKLHVNQAHHLLELEEFPQE
jgi:hypothetical protein